MSENESVNLTTMNEPEFLEFLNAEVEGYANEKVKAGAWKREDAYELSRRDFMSILPQGKDTKGHSIMNITDAKNRENVGILWVEWHNVNHNSLFIWDILIYDKYRRKGYGSAALKHLEGLARGRGISGISLHVFGHNKPAIAMYNSLGFYTEDIIMKKVLAGNEGKEA